MVMDTGSGHAPAAGFNAIARTGSSGDQEFAGMKYFSNASTTNATAIGRVGPARSRPEIDVLFPVCP
jgi:hypothetical protein